MARLYGQSGDGFRDVVLTFDDGPHRTNTARLLDILKDHKIEAMFFVVGKRLTSDGRKLVKRAHAQGHLIGNHAYGHRNLRKLSLEQIRDELWKAHQLIVECTGGCQYFRPPFGAGSANVDKVVGELGYTSVLWNVDTEDWKREKSGEWVEHGMNQIQRREDSIVLMHDIHKTTVDQVESLVTRIKRIKGHRFSLY